MSYRIGIVGAGLIGRTLAFELSKENYQVTIFDSDSVAGHASCGFAGAGMLAPYSELETCESVIFELGRNAISLWSQIIETLPAPVFLQASGTLLVAHAQDKPILVRVKRLIEQKGPDASDDIWLQQLSDIELNKYEPALAGRFSGVVLLALEGQLDNRQLMQALCEGLNRAGVQCHFDTRVIALRPGQIETISEQFNFDLVIDCRGLGAKADIANLRGVRGEMIEVVAPDVKLSRPIRLMHPRYPIYIVPREKHHFLIGATSIESESKSAITVQSTLELLSAAYSVDSAFAEAHIIESRVNCRPALSDNKPRIFQHSGLMRVNGLYRHGFLITPKLVQIIVQFIKSGRPDTSFECLFNSEESLLCKL
jgi:glycine oxidase